MDRIVDRLGDGNGFHNDLRWDGHYCEEDFRQVVCENSLFIALSQIGLKKIEMSLGFELSAASLR